MIGDQPTGLLPGVEISAVSHEGLRVLANGSVAQLAVIREDGTVICAGAEVAREVEAVAVNCYRNFLKGKGFLRVFSSANLCDPASWTQGGAV